MTPLHANPSPTARRTLAGRLLAALALFLAIGLAVPPAEAQDEPVTLNFTNADIEAVVKAVAEITGKSFIVDPRVKGTVTIVSARPVPRSLVYPTLLSALRTQGVTALESDNVVRIVPIRASCRGPVDAALMTATTGDRMRYESRRSSSTFAPDDHVEHDRGVSQRQCVIITFGCAASRGDRVIDHPAAEAGSRRYGMPRQSIPSHAASRRSVGAAWQAARDRRRRRAATACATDNGGAGARVPADRAARHASVHRLPAQCRGRARRAALRARPEGFRRRDRRLSAAVLGTDGLNTTASSPTARSRCPTRAPRRASARPARRFLPIPRTTRS
jgi:hypothetical protein